VSYDPKVWTQESVGDGWFMLDTKNQEIPAFFDGGTVSYGIGGEINGRWSDLAPHGFRRSRLPVCSAERHAALERLAGMLSDVREVLDNYADVLDGDEGRSIANDAMSARDRLDAALAAVEAAR
jgi:hypothetical protein